jgi:AraC-like DNA-binding protein
MICDIILWDAKGHYETASENYTLNANQFMMLPPGKFHNYQADIHNPWSIYWVHFSGELLHDLNRWLQTEEYVQPTNIDYNKKIIEQWAEMFAALDNGYSAKNLAFANLCLYKFLTFFLCQPNILPGIKEENPIEDSIVFMKSNIDKVLSVDELACQLNYSGSHYTALFKEKTMQAPIEYFIKLKVQYARQLLNQSNLKINEIADKVGYADPLYFSRLFKKITGKSPKEYRLAFNKEKIVNKNGKL